VLVFCTIWNIEMLKMFRIQFRPNVSHVSNPACLHSKPNSVWWKLSKWKNVLYMGAKKLKFFLYVSYRSILITEINSRMTWKNFQISLLTKSLPCPFNPVASIQNPIQSDENFPNEKCAAYGRPRNWNFYYLL
jgi:hypothetical protein